MQLDGAPVRFDQVVCWNNDKLARFNRFAVEQTFDHCEIKSDDGLFAWAWINVHNCLLRAVAGIRREVVAHAARVGSWLDWSVHSRLLILYNQVNYIHR